MDWAAMSVVEGEEDAITAAQALNVTLGALMSRCHQLQETLHTTDTRR